MKRILKSRPVQAVLCSLIGLYIWFVYRTSRWEVVDGGEPHLLLEEGKPFIAAVWHGRIGMMPYSVAMPHGIRVLISNHRDGAIIAGAIKFFGYKTIRGSSTDGKKSKQKGGTKALRAMIQAMRDGNTILITPDGPRGPRMRAREGTVKLAQITGAPIFPLSYSIRHRRIANSWDKFIIPRPFSRGVFVWGEPIRVPRKADRETIERFRQHVEKELNAVTRKADQRVGQSVIEPAPVPEAPGSI